MVALRPLIEPLAFVSANPHTHLSISSLNVEHVMRRQRQKYEQEMSALAIRAKPLGEDRQHRRYWWGLGGQRGCLFVEDSDPRLMGAWNSMSEVDALIAALDRRGVRELGLLTELNKVGAHRVLLARDLRCIRSDHTHW